MLRDKSNAIKIDLARLDGISQVFLAGSKCVLVKLEPRQDANGGTYYAKLPYQPNGILARSNDSATWSSWQAAKAAYLAGRNLPDGDPRRFDGIGRMFTKDDGVVFVDWDGVIAADGKPAPEFLADAAKFQGAWWEISTSGRGVHAFGLATLPDKHRNRKNGENPELYDHTRFCVLTGVRPSFITTPDNGLGNIQTACDEVLKRLEVRDESTEQLKLYDAKPVNVQRKWTPELLELARRVARLAGWQFNAAGKPTHQGSAFNAPAKLWRNVSDGDLVKIITFPSLLVVDGDETLALWRGEWQSYFNDQSTADAWLMRKLGYWTCYNAKRAFDLYASSELAKSELSRDKWLKRPSAYWDYCRRYLADWCAKQVTVHQACKQAESIAPELSGIDNLRMAIQALPANRIDKAATRVKLEPLILEAAADLGDWPFEDAYGLLASMLQPVSHVFSDLEVRRYIGRGVVFAKKVNGLSGADRATQKAEWLKNFAVSFNDAEIKVLAKHREIFDRELEHIKPVRFGITLLDRAIGTMLPGEICAINGAPGAVKTSLALNAVDNYLLTHDGIVLFASADMSANDIFMRLMERTSNVSDVQLRESLYCELSHYHDTQAQVADRYARLKIIHNDGAKRLTLDDVIDRALECSAELVVIDYLTQLEKPGDTDLGFVNEALPKLHEFTHEYKVPVILLSQMSRASRNEQSGGRLGGHGRGGGKIEEIATIELELFKEDDDFRVYLSKTRHGKSGVYLSLEYDGICKKFTGRARKLKLADKKAGFSRFEVLGDYIGAPDDADDAGSVSMPVPRPKYPDKVGIKTVDFETGKVVLSIRPRTPNDGPYLSCEERDSSGRVRHRYYSDGSEMADLPF